MSDTKDAPEVKKEGAATAAAATATTAPAATAAAPASKPLSANAASFTFNAKVGCSTPS